MLDGVYVLDPDGGSPTFVAVDPPTDDQVQHLVEQAAYRLIGLLQRRGVVDDAQVDAQADQEPVLAAIAAASIQGLVATGERAGRRVRRGLSDPAEGIRTARETRLKHLPSAGASSPPNPFPPPEITSAVVAKHPNAAVLPRRDLVPAALNCRYSRLLVRPRRRHAHVPTYPPCILRPALLFFVV